MARKELLTAVAVLAQIPAIARMSALPTLLNIETCTRIQPYASP
jgi:hypothetical protein